MTELDDHWAQRRIEAAADGSLSRRDARRLRAALRKDPELARELESARALRRALRRMRNEPAPRDLQRRLLDIAAGTRELQRRLLGQAAAERAARPLAAGAFLSWASAGAAACAVAAAWLVLALPNPPTHDRREAALRDFQIAMSYLHRSYRIAGDHVQRAMLRELQDALDLGRQRGNNGRDENGG